MDLVYSPAVMGVLASFIEGMLTPASTSGSCGVRDVSFYPPQRHGTAMITKTRAASSKEV
ncbi:hypothetical protein BGE01nite_57290 [Brevifollis gellanilyticus]|uniref:Uncharacterized protein n=1 Tax=Brevifollis gellanilyticus TaxID=748831 RepID=A0A512MI89_9BACT|nr:hypothetical protein BGE01nite_57290 [Brevifollis gellanilyticus]